jgi:hypothetical protein
VASAAIVGSLRSAGDQHGGVRDELTDEEAAEMALLDALEKDNARDARHEADDRPLSIPKPEGGGLSRLLVKRPTDAKDEDAGSL